MLVGPDDEMDNDWEDSRPVSNNELKETMDKQHESLAESLLKKFEILEKRMDAVVGACSPSLPMPHGDCSGTLAHRTCEGLLIFSWA